MAEYDKLLSEKTKIVATIHISNAYNQPIKYMIDQAHTYGAVFNRWSASSHLNPICRIVILCFSGHKICGPTA
jgi:cysteine desulfurase/selenocysteine lyase